LIPRVIRLVILKGIFVWGGFSEKRRAA
jgi:hypothetical protein